MRVLVLILFILVVNGLRAEEPPVDVTVYYSAEDKHWSDAEKIIDAVARKFPRLRIQKKSIDTDEGYKELSRVEKDNQIRKHGDLTLVMGPLTLTSKGDRRDIETYFEGMIARLLDPSKAKGRLKTDVPAFVKDVFGAEAEVHMLPPTLNENILYFRVEKAGKQLGFVADAYKPIACPVCNDAQALIATDTELKLLEVRPVRGLERMGTPLDEKESDSFTLQFKGKKSKDEIKVDTISGATKTSHAYESLVGEVAKDLQKAGSK